MEDVQGLRKLAVWYREFAERAGNPWIWEARLRRADELESEADHQDRQLTQIRRAVSPPKA